MLALAAYLYVGLGALLLERTALLHAEGIGYAHGGRWRHSYWPSSMLIGHALHLVKRYRHKPLIWPTCVHGAASWSCCWC